MHSMAPLSIIFLLYIYKYYNLFFLNKPSLYNWPEISYKKGMHIQNLNWAQVQN